MHFFERVKRALDNRETYNEFLKVVNLFTQDYIDTARLVKESKHFLGDGDLYRQFKDILGWDELKEREYLMAEFQNNWTQPTPVHVPRRVSRINPSVKYGSYRRLSGNVSNITMLRKLRLTFPSGSKCHVFRERRDVQNRSE